MVPCTSTSEHILVKCIYTPLKCLVYVFKEVILNLADGDWNMVLFVGVSSVILNTDINV